MAQGLLGWHTGDLIQPGRGFLLLERSQGSRGVAVEDVFPALSVGIGAQAQCPVIHETRTTKGPGERLALARCRRATVLIGAFVGHADLFFFSQAKPERRGAFLPFP
jgi:hypothetical protein